MNQVSNLEDAKMVGTVRMSEIERSHMLTVIPKIMRVQERQLLDWSDEKLVTQLQEFFVKTNANIAFCDRCGGGSDAKLDACPFCGDADDEGDIGDDDEEEDDVLRNDLEDSNMEEVSEMKTTNGIASKSKAMIVTKPVRTRMVKAKPETVPAVVDSGPKQTISDLDDAIVQVTKLKGKTAASLWEMGTFLNKEIDEKQLWKLRLDENGKPKYKKFAAFVKAELNISINFAYRTIEIAKMFPLEVAQEIGRSHLKILCGAPEEDREELLELTKQGIDVRSLYKKIKKARKERGLSLGKEGPRQNIALILPNKVTKYSLFAKPLKKSAPLKACKKISDLPYAVIEGVNENTFIARIVENSAGEWELVLEPKTKED